MVFYGIISFINAMDLVSDMKIKRNVPAGKTGYSSKTKVKKGSSALLLPLYGILRIFFRLRGIRVRPVNKLGRQPEAPSIVLCNHGSFLDFFYAEVLLLKSRPHYVVARLYFYHKFLGTLLKKLGCFPKSMFALDIESTKNCLAVLKNGEVLAMMPEARLSTVGRFEDIQDSTYSFLKKAQVPIYTVKLQGDYFADPKWGKGFRRGSVVEAELDILFTAQQVQTLSVQQLRQGVEERLRYDEFQWLSANPKQKYRSRRLAEGLENILTLCPQCGSKYTITTKGKDVFCRHCGKLTSLDNRYAFDPGFRFENFAQWYDWQKESLARQMAGDPDFRLTSEVELRLPGTGNSLTRSAGRGVCTLDRSGLTYTGTRDGQPVQFHFPMYRIYRLLFGAGTNFEIYDGSEILYFVPEERRSAADWYLASMLLSDEAKAQISQP